MNIFFCKEKQFILLVEDDIHFIHAPRKPSSSTTSTSWHMCTALADIHDEIEAVPQNVDINQNHRSVRVTMTDGTVRQCRGGIDINHLLGYLRVKLPSYFSSSYLSSLPGEYKMFDLSNVQHSFENLRYPNSDQFYLVVQKHLTSKLILNFHKVIYIVLFTT